MSVDSEDQPFFRERFGDEAFVKGDATSWALMSKLRDRHRAFGCMSGPPCQFYSTIRVRGLARSPPLIDATRDQLSSLFDFWSIENVPGARQHMRNPVELRGSDFGLAVDRPRLFEANFGVRVDDCVRQAGNVLRARCCLGKRRRWRELDAFKRPSGCVCCEGNTFALQGTRPWRCTTAECADAMGVDRGHMDYERLAQSIPPDYGQLVFTQMCMARAHAKFGVPVVTFDDFIQRPDESRRLMSRWLRGAGDERPESALELVGPGGDQMIGSRTAEHSGPEGKAPGGQIPEDLPFRELFYSHAGGFDQRFGGGQLLDLLKPSVELTQEPSCSTLVGKNTYIETSVARLKRLANVVASAVALGPGTRVTVRAAVRHEHWLRRSGWRVVDSILAGQTRPDDYVFLCIGRRGGGSKESYLDHDFVEQFMDPRDRGIGEEPKERKEIRSWTYYPHDPEMWSGKGLDPPVEDLMTRGALVEMLAERPATEVKQYPFPSVEAHAECLLEADRALATGHMEYVPDEEVRDVLASCVVHPWLIVQQGPKWRACHDYSVGTNRSAGSAPFGLPTTWDVRKLLKPTSRLCKYDLRDGFWACPVGPESRRRLCMRHPATGRLMQCARLPFGYLDSPRLFCSVSESMAAEFRKRVAGMG